MNTIRIATILASVLLPALAPSLSSAGDPKPFEVEFDKCASAIVNPGYLVTFAGTASGGVQGTVQARILVNTPGIEPNQTHIQADYVLTGTLPFTARVGGRVNNSDNLAVLRGYVSEGPAWLIGAGVRDEFLNYTKADGTRCSKGILYVRPRWKQTHGDDND